MGQAAAAMYPAVFRVEDVDQVVVEFGLVGLLARPVAPLACRGAPPGGLLFAAAVRL